MRILISTLALLALTSHAMADDPQDHYQRIDVTQAESVSVAHASLAKMKTAAKGEDMLAIHQESYTMEEAIKSMQGLTQIDVATQHSLAELAEKIHVQSERGNITQVRESLAAFERVLGAVAH